MCPRLYLVLMFLGVPASHVSGQISFNSVAIDGVAIAGGVLDSFHVESIDSFEDAVASFENGLLESHLASVVVQSQFFDDHILAVGVNVLASSNSSIATTRSADASGLAVIDFVLSVPTQLQPVVSDEPSESSASGLVSLMRVSDRVAVDLTQVTLLEPVEYRLRIEATAYADSDASMSSGGAFVSLDFAFVPEPTGLVLFAAGSVIVLLCDRRGRKT